MSFFWQDKKKIFCMIFFPFSDENINSITVDHKKMLKKRGTGQISPHYLNKKHNYMVRRNVCIDKTSNR